MGSRAYVSRFDKYEMSSWRHLAVLVGGVWRLSKLKAWTMQETYNYKGMRRKPGPGQEIGRPPTAAKDDRQTTAKRIFKKKLWRPHEKLIGYPRSIKMSVHAHARATAAEAARKKRTKQAKESQLVFHRLKPDQGSGHQSAQTHMRL
jgi:hypothetical protein